MKRYKFTYITLLGLLVALLSAFFFLRPVMASAQTSAAEYEERQYSTATLDDDFADDCIIVIMDKKSSTINKPITKNISQIAQTSIIDLTYIEGNIEDKKYLNKDEFHQIFKISLPIHSKENVLEAIQKYKDMDGVLWVGPNYYDTPGELPIASEGTRYPELWGLFDTPGIQAEQAWSITMGSKDVTVGVIDSGIADHPDLQANVTTGWDFYNDNEITNDDESSHGTHVAGTIGATGATRDGVIGVCPNVTLVPLQVIDENKLFDVSAVIKAITWAINHNIDILNYSGGGSSDYTQRRVAIQNYKGLFVCSAGNKGADVDLNRHYPSDYSRDQDFSERVISVGNIKQNGQRASDSNYGINSVSIYAPGSSICSTVPYSYNSTGYSYKSGTSMAAPHVTGVAALLLSQYPTLTAAELKETILSNADDITISIPSDSGSGSVDQNVKKLNAYKALKSPHFKVAFDKQGGQGGDDDVYATYQESMPAATAPTRTGYTFQGYYSKPEGKGIQYYDADMVSVRNWDNTETRILYAYWVGNEYTVTLDMQGGMGGTSIITATYGSPMPTAKAPTRTGYTFQGYYSQPGGKGIQYYDADMVSVRNWDIANNAKLYAYMTNNIYTVWLGPNYSVEATYDKDMPLAVAPEKIGYTFKGYWYDDKQYYDEEMSSVNYWDIDENNIHLEAHWENNEYRVKLIDGEEITATYDKDMPSAKAPIPPIGYEFKGYYAEPGGKGTKYYNSDMSSAHVWDIDDETTLYASYELIYYNVTYVEYDEYGEVYRSYTAKQSYFDPIEEQPILSYKKGYKFDGWYLNGNKIGFQEHTTRSMTLTGKWLGTKMTVSATTTKPTLVGEYIVIELTQQFNTYCELSIPARTKYVYIYSTYKIDYKMYITFDARTDDVELCLDNVSYTAPTIGNTPTNGITLSSLVMLNLYTYGTVDIRGSKGTEGGYGGTGIFAFYLTIWEASSKGNLYIYGGNGGDGIASTIAKAGAGGNGGEAIQATEIIIKTHYVYLIGGNGGNGGRGSSLLTSGNGGQGGKAYSGSLINESYNIVTKNGSNGSNGYYV